MKHDTSDRSELEAVEGLTVKLIVLLSAARFGANLFESSLRSVAKNSVLVGELFRERGENVAEIADLLGMRPTDLEKQITKSRSGIWQAIRELDADRPVVIRVYYYHLDRASLVWDDIAQHVRVVHLVRRNLFNAYVSREIALSSSVWRTNNSQIASTIAAAGSLNIDPKKAEKYVSDRLEDIRWSRDTLSVGDYCEIAFEDICYSSTVRRELVIRGVGKGNIGEFDENARPVNESTIRIKQICNVDLISNYSEISHLDRRYF